jgi:O-antigen/teichoic acid export membrane protein
MTKEELTPSAKHRVSEQPDSGLAIVAMILGVVSLTGPGLLLGIPAIVTGIIALKRSNVNRALSITGLVTGIISTVLSVLFLTFIAFIIGWAANHPEEFQPEYYQTPEFNEQMFESSRT